MNAFSTVAAGDGRAAIALALLLGLVAASSPARAQSPGSDRLVGRVERQGEPVSGVDVSLHRVTPDSSGVIAATVSGPDGRFDFGLPPADTGDFTVFFATAEYATVRHFGAPIHPDDPREGYAIEVFDTTSTPAGAVRIVRRDLVLLPHADGGWEINEIVRLRNTGTRTLVPPSGSPEWGIPLPEGATDFEAGGAEMPRRDLERVGDRVYLAGALIPGPHDLFLRYRLPGAASPARLAVDVPMDSVNVFVRQPGPHLTVQGLEPQEIVEVQGERFLQLSATGLAPGAVLPIDWESDRPPVPPVAAGVGAAVLVLLVGAGAALRGGARRAE